MKILLISNLHAGHGRGRKVLPAIQAWLERESLPLDHLEVHRPNLETLYLNLTGRALRE